MLSLVSDFKTILRKAWSIRLALVSALFSGFAALVYVLPLFEGHLSPSALAWLGVLAIVGTIVAPLAALGAAGARIVAQPKMRGDK
jgi:VIT1/CCC1 family predicted Fe2+/Mn2+ transporter